MKGSSIVNQPPLRPLYTIITKCIKQIDTIQLVQTRNFVVKASEEIEQIK